MGYDVVRTEHTGAKNGGGYWGLRIAAKQGSSKARRQNSRHEIEEALMEEDATKGSFESRDDPVEDEWDPRYLLELDEDPYEVERDLGGESGAA